MDPLNDNETYTSEDIRSKLHSKIGVVHILRNQLRGGGGFPNDYASVILIQ